jgi:hypothetical protein
MKTLQLGSTGPEVRALQEMLKAEGYDPGPVDGDFGNKTFSALQEFQGARQDQEGNPLEPDGVCGPITWWALHNASGDAQRSWLDAMVPDNLTTKRNKVCELICHEHRKGVQEIPLGSNGGDGVDKYTKGWKAPWCAMFVSWALEEALGFSEFNDPPSQRQAAVINIYRTAKEKGWFKSKRDYTPRPGDIFIMLYRDKNGNLTGKGHTGFVLWVSAGGQTITTCEGNAGNRLKIRLRKVSQDTLVGFVNYMPIEENSNNSWERGILKSAKNLGRETTR